MCYSSIECRVGGADDPLLHTDGRGWECLTPQGHFFYTLHCNDFVNDRLGLFFFTEDRCVLKRFRRGIYLCHVEDHFHQYPARRLAVVAFLSCSETPQRGGTGYTVVAFFCEPTTSNSIFPADQGGCNLLDTCT